MMDTKHTPGPWKVYPEWPFPDEQGRKHDAVVVDSGTDTVLICSFEHSVMREHQNANARLCAAAPELLAMLKLAARYLHHPDVQAMPFAMSVEVVANRVDAAIAKAEGAQP